MKKNLLDGLLCESWYNCCACITSAKEVVFLSGFVCGFVSLFVNKITQKLMDRF